MLVVRVQSMERQVGTVRVIPEVVERRDDRRTEDLAERGGWSVECSIDDDGDAEEA
jgi:hypothetical protein